MSAHRNIDCVWGMSPRHEVTLNIASTYPFPITGSAESPVFLCLTCSLETLYPGPVSLLQIFWRVAFLANTLS